jgi:hypothetical protein
MGEQAWGGVNGTAHNTTICLHRTATLNACDAPPQHHSIAPREWRSDMHCNLSDPDRAGHTRDGIHSQLEGIVAIDSVDLNIHVMGCLPARSGDLSPLLESSC